MKTVYALSIVQLLAIIFLAFKIISLETQIETLDAANDSQNQTQESHALASDAQHSTLQDPVNTNTTFQAPNLSLENIRLVVRKELQATLAKLELTTQSQKKPTDALSNIPSDPQKVDKMDYQLEYFMSDGKFSAEELSQVETTLATMNYDDRQRVLHKMAQAMNKAKINFNN